MLINPKEGDKVVFTANGGYKDQITEAKKHLTLGGVYQIDSVQMGGWATYIRLCGMTAAMNTAMFDDYVEPAAPAQPDQDQMTLRDRFAMAAMQEFMRNSFVMEDFAPKVVAELSFKMADSMLEERKPK